MMFKENDNKLDFCQYCQWFSDEGVGGMFPLLMRVYTIHPTHRLNTIKGIIHSVQEA